MAATRSAPATPAIVRGPDVAPMTRFASSNAISAGTVSIAERHIERLSGMVMPSIAGIEMAQ